MTTNSHNSVERKIFFYRADVGSDDSGKPLPFDPSPALSVIDGLPFTDGDNGRYEPDADDDVLCLFRSASYSNSALRFCRIRRSGLPQLERAGSISNLVISSDSGLLEPVHIVFFPNNVVGIEYNHFGPRPSRLSPYLSNKSNQIIQPVHFSPLYYRDMSDRLNNLTELSLLEFRIKPSYSSIVRNIDNSLADALDANAALFDSLPVVEVVVRIQRNDRQAALARFLGPVGELLRRNDLRDNSDRFKVRGRLRNTGLLDTINLLESHIVSTKGVVRVGARSRAIDPSSAFDAIHEAYAELKAEIDDASSIVP